MEQNHLTEKILNLTLEIIFLLTGEDYGPMKMSSDCLKPSSRPRGCRKWSRGQFTKPTPCSSKVERTYVRKILQVTQKITELLTGEVPIRCQDVTVYFSMEEWEYLEGHKDLYKDVMMEKRPPLTSADGSRNTPERCPRPVYSRDCIKEHQENLEEHQEIQKACPLNSRDFTHEHQEIPKAQALYSQNSLEEHHEIPEACSLYSTESIQLHQEIPQTRSLYSRDYTSKHHEILQAQPLPSQNSTPKHHEIPQAHPVHSTKKGHNILVEQGENMMTFKAEVKEEEDDVYVIDDESCKEEEIPIEISTGIQHNMKNLKKLPVICPDGDVEQNITFDSSEEDSRIIYLSCDDLFSDSSTPGGSFLDPSPPDTSYTAHNGKVMLPYFKHEEDYAQRAELILLQRSYMRENTFSLDYGEGYVEMSSLMEGERLHVDTKPYTCFECGKSFTRKANFLTHQRAHTGEKPFSCSECGESFTRRSSLTAHESLHVVEKQFSCMECGKCFYSKASLLAHEKSHTDDKLFSCTECGEQFTRKSSLMVHESLHSGMRQYPCPDCGKYFSRKANLIMHRKIHTGEKPFSCLQCGERFTRKSSLNRHQIVHTGIRPFACSECGETFNRSSSLIRHRKVHMAKSYSCLECGKCFQLRSHLLYHQQSYASKPYSCSELSHDVTETMISF